MKRKKGFVYCEDCKYRASFGAGHFVQSRWCWRDDYFTEAPEFVGNIPFKPDAILKTDRNSDGGCVVFSPRWSKKMFYRGRA
jgi:hypothetical protein